MMKTSRFGKLHDQQHPSIKVLAWLSLAVAVKHRQNQSFTVRAEPSSRNTADGQRDGVAANAEMQQSTPAPEGEQSPPVPNL